VAAGRKNVANIVGSPKWRCICPAESIRFGECLGKPEEHMTIKYKASWCELLANKRKPE